MTAPPPTSLRLTTAGPAIGVDLGGTKIEAVLLVHGEERNRLRVPTPRDDYAATLSAVVGLVRTLEHHLDASASVGLGIPGGIEPSTGLVKNANSTWLIGRPFKADVEHALARPVVVANDADCFALSEATDGAGAGAAVVFGVIIGTGVGAGLVCEGRPGTGPNGTRGEWGHNPLPWALPEELPGPVCYCGRHGCLETWLSGPGLAADHQRVTGRICSAEQIAAAASRGDGPASASLARYAHRAARGLAAVINVVDPDVIVLGGGVSNIQPLYEAIPRVWSQFVFSCDRGLDTQREAAAGVSVRTILRRARHGDASGVRGAAWLGASTTRIS